MRTAFMEPGRLRMLVSLQSQVPVPDGLGGSEAGWQETASLFALVEPVSVKSEETADGTRQVATHRVWIRHRPGVVAGMRLVFRGRFLSVQAVHDPDESGRYAVLLAREETP